MAFKYIPFFFKPESVGENRTSHFVPRSLIVFFFGQMGICGRATKTSN